MLPPMHWKRVGKIIRSLCCLHVRVLDRRKPCYRERQGKGVVRHLDMIHINNSLVVFHAICKGAWSNEESGNGGNDDFMMRISKLFYNFRLDKKTKDWKWWKTNKWPVLKRDVCSGWVRSAAWRKNRKARGEAFMLKGEGTSLLKTPTLGKSDTGLFRPYNGFTYFLLS